MKIPATSKVTGILFMLFFVIFRQPATQHQFSCRLYFIHSAKLCCAWGVVEKSGLGLSFFGDLDHCISEGIQRIFVLGLGWLDHQRFVDDEREVICRRMEVVIHQAFGDVERAHDLP